MDINHYFSADVNSSGTGDLSIVDGTTMTEQRLIRRLLTNPGDYTYHPDYGIGAARYVGATVADLNALKALILSQVLQEPGVSAVPAPVVTLESNNTTLTCVIQYVDSTGATQVVSFSTEGV